MRFLVLSNDNINVELISIALIEQGTCINAHTNAELLELLKAGFASSDPYKAVFLQPDITVKDGFNLLHEIRKLEANREINVQVVFLCEDMAGSFVLNTFSKKTESFISKNIIKREILEILISKKIIN